MNPIQLKKHFLLLALLLGIVACGSQPVVNEFPPTASPATEIAVLEKNLNEAKEKQVDILSPKNFKEAQNSLNEAKKKFLKGKESQKALHEVAVGNAYLSNANSVAEVAHDNIEDIIRARKAAMEAGAPGYFSKEFKKTDKELADIAKDIEKNKLKASMAARSRLEGKYLRLEVDSIKEKHLKESRDIIARTKKEDAQRYAPRVLAIAEKSYAETEAYIQANPHNSENIAERAQETKNAAYHAFNINRTAKGAAKVTSEEMVLMLEKERLRAIENETQRDLLEDKLETTQAALEKEKADQTSLVLTTEELEAQKEKLEAEKSLNEKYEAARKQFASNEAEVYKQGDSLLIRLKGIEFLPAAATIQSKSYPLLTKVQKVVEDFGDGTAVTVEGHTDSTGGKIVNNRLSANRAQAVKEYLQANSGGIDLEIETVGLGDQKPVSTNKTASGRAQNRRVDIIIKPDTTKL